MTRISRTGVVLLALVACSDGPTAPGQEPYVIEELPRALTASEHELIGSSNSFAFDLLGRAVAGSPGENVLLSPFSVSMALGMTLNGARGGTFDAMRSTLGFDGLDQAQINESYRGLLDLLTSLDPSVEMMVANSTWSRQGIPFEGQFFTDVTTYFDAYVRELDFGDPTSKDSINAWVKEKTNGRIESIVDQITPLDILFLINAVYFKGDWTFPFDPDRTAPALFDPQDGTAPFEVDMMSESLTLNLGGDAETQVGELLYGGQAFSMVLAVPRDNRTVDDLLAGMDEGRWASWMASLSEAQGHPVQMPRFEMEYDVLLNSALKALGMDVAFDPNRADFSGLTSAGDAHISRVKHKTFLKVDEVGTEAAAATSVGIGLTSVPTPLRLDRPFVLAIRERLSGTLLFLGVVRDPR